MKIEELRKGDTVNFDMISPGIMSSQYKSVYVAGIVSYDAAAAIDNEVNVKHRNFYPFFKQTVNNIDDPSIYDYLILKAEPTSNELFVIGETWIAPGTLEVTQGRIGTVLIGNWQQRFEAPLKDFLANLGASYTLQVRDKTS